MDTETDPTVAASLALAETIPQDSPLAWIAQQMETGEAETPVYHFKIQAKERQGDRWAIKCDIRRRADDTPERIHDRIEREAARQNCAELRIIATVRQSQTPVSTFPWPTDFIGDPEVDDHQADDKDGSLVALLKQSHRHNEFMLSALLKVCGSQASLTQQMQQQSKQQQEAIWAERLEMMALVKGFHDDKAEREAEKVKWETLGHAGKTMAEAMAYKLTQGKVAPDAKANILDGALRRFGSSITPEQAEALGSILTQPQLIALNALTTAPADTAEKIRKARAEKDHEQRANARTAENKPDADPQ